MPVNHLNTVAAKFRNGLSLLSPLNEKTPKGEVLGYLTAMLYLAPAEVAGGKTVCPYSTPACREGCLFTAGRGKTTRVFDARVRRTRFYHESPDGFLAQLILDLSVLSDAAAEHDMTLAIRLNGTSDIAWERVETTWGRKRRTLFEIFPDARFYDYTRIPLKHRKLPSNWHITYSLADGPLSEGIDYLRAGHSVSAIVPYADKHLAPDWLYIGGQMVSVIDGDEHDLRFLDPSSSLVLLKPKGRLLRPGSPMVRLNLFRDLVRREKAA